MKLVILHFFIILIFYCFNDNISAQTLEDRIAMGQYLKPSFHEQSVLMNLNYVNCLYSEDIWNDNPYVIIYETSGHSSRSKIKHIDKITDDMSCAEVIEAYRNYYSGNLMGENEGN